MEEIYASLLDLIEMNGDTKSEYDNYYISLNKSKYFLNLSI